MIENIKARLKAKRFNILTEEIDSKNREGYFIYKGNLYFGNRFGVFFRSYQILWKTIYNKPTEKVSNEKRTDNRTYSRRIH